MYQLAKHTTIGDLKKVVPCLYKTYVTLPSETNTEISRYPVHKNVKLRMAHFAVHPEKLQQIVKERDAQTLCSFFASDEYKNKVTALLEKQQQRIGDLPRGIPQDEIHYEHIINCAQPALMKKSEIEMPREGVNTGLPEHRVKKKPVRVTIMSIMLKKKMMKDADPENIAPATVHETTVLPIVLEKTLLKKKKKYRKRTTILPLILKNMQNKFNYMYGTRETADSRGQSSRSLDKDNPDKSRAVNHFPNQGNLVTRRNLTSLAQIESTNVDKKEDSSVFKTKADFRKFKSQPRKGKRSLSNINKKIDYINKIEVQPTLYKRDIGKITLPEVKINTKRPTVKYRPRRARSLKQEKLSRGSEWNMPLDVPYHFDNSLEDVLDVSNLQTRQLSTYKLLNTEGIHDDAPIIADVLALFGKVKADSQRKMAKMFKLSQPKHSPQSRNNAYRSSYPETNMDDSFERKDKYAYLHLVRLPKTTPEGYRVLLYSVRISDPTRLVFSDAVKTFCMYNDIVLSMDGLQEGYIVLFDMKGVQIGHLARVSLPALRCFMLYIQEAHPARLKGVHILNTASWIHHIMRLIIPLVKSELLSMVKFHKGNIPDDFPLELLPQEYGGEQPSMDELDKETILAMTNYRDWLIDTTELVTDESKRVKKSSWWGFFTGNSKAPDNVEMDEKTILKNLQID